MNTKKNKKPDFTKKVEKVIKEAKTSATKINNFALNTTEEIVTESITITSQWQEVADKALKGGVRLLDNQQNLIFDTLETYKKHFLNGKKRFSKVFA
jgi:hypothetical protein